MSHHEREKAWKPMHGFLQILPVSFPFADPVMHPFTVINFSSENYMLSPVSPSSESPNMWVVLGTPETS